MYTNGGSPLRVPLLTAAATGTSKPVACLGYSLLTFYLKTNGSPGAGTLVLEEADWNPGTEPPSSLTWSTIDTITITTNPGNSAQYAYHVGGPGGSFAYNYVRCRIGTAVTVATLDVVLVAI